MKVIMTLALALIPIVFQVPDVSQAAAESAAFAKIGAEKNLEAKKKLVTGFEKNFPNSDRLPELYIELSRTLISGIDFEGAKLFAEKGVASVARMKASSVKASTPDPARQQWLDSLDTSTKKNLAWVNEMIAWRDQRVRSSVTRKR